MSVSVISQEASDQRGGRRRAPFDPAGKALTLGIAALIALLALAALLTAPADAAGLRAPDAAALRALGSADGSQPVIVFRARTPLPAGTVVAEAGMARSASANSAAAPDRADRRERLRRAGATVGKAPVVLRVGSEPAWLYYEDRGPFQLFEHPGRVALVGVRSGRVQLSRTLDWPPLAGGRLPLYLRSADGYRSARYRVLTRLPRAGASAGTRAKSAATGSARQRAVSAGAEAAAKRLAAEDSCAITVADMLDDSYDYASVDRTRAAFGGLLADLERRDRGFVAARYSTADALSPTAFVDRLVRRHGCRSVLLFIAGGGVRGGATTISLGVSGHRSGRIEQQDLRGSELRALIAAHPAVDWQLLVDAPYAGGLVEQLRGEPNVRVLLTASEADEPTHACIPGIARLCSGSGAQLAFTSRMISGIQQLFADTAALDRAVVASGTSGPFAGRLLADGYERGAPASALKPLRQTPRRYVNFRSPGSGRGPDQHSLRLPPFAHDQTVSTDEDTPVRIDLAGGDELQAALGTYSTYTQPRNGRVTPIPGDDRYVTYTPDPNDNGTDSFQFLLRFAVVLPSIGRVTINVRPVVDAPVVTTSAGDTAYTEDDPPVAVDGALTVRDDDSADLTGATATISGGYVNGQDVLAFASTPSISGTWNAARGELRLTGTASRADYESALRTIAYANTSSDPTAGRRTVAFTATDGTNISAVATKGVAVRAVNDRPVVTLAGGVVAYTENDPATAIDATLTVTDADSPQLASATVAIARDLASGEDVLEATGPLPGGITASYDPARGTLTLSGRASLADYETALRAIGYRNTSDAPSTATRTVEVVATDTGGASSAVVSRDVTIAAVNDRPVADDDDYATGADAVLTVPAPGALTNDRDADGDTLAISEVDGSGARVGTDITTARGATLRVNADGSLTYDPSGQFSGLRPGEEESETVAYTVADGRGGSDTATIRVTVRGVNDRPDASDDAYDTSEDDLLTVAAPGVLGNDSDADGDALTVDQVDGSGANVGSAFRTARGATVTVDADGSLSYDPAGAFDALRPGEEARDAITYRATDGGSGDTATITVTVRGANDRPVADDDGYDTGEDDLLTVAAPGALANDSDADGDALTIDEVDGSGARIGAAYRTARGATVRVNADGSLSYDPDGQFAGLRAGEEARDTVTYRVTDGTATDSATITVTVRGANDGPVAADDSYDTSEDDLLTVAAPGALANDRDADGDTLTIDEVDGSGSSVGTDITTARGATLRVDADGSLSYDPNGQFESLRAGDEVRETVTYRVTDGTTTDTATITITVRGANDRPDAADDAYDTDEDTLLTVAAPGALANDSDADSGTTLTIDEVDGSGARVGAAYRTARGATVRANADGSLSYDPAGAFDALRAGEEARDAVTYRVTDGGSTDTATITITVRGLNDRPDAIDDSYETDEDTLLTVAAPGVLGNDRDPEGEALTVDEVDGSAGNVGTAFRAASGATVRVNADGSLSYDPGGQFDALRAGEQVRDTVTYRVTDGTATDSATISFTIRGVNDRPDAADDAYDTDEDTLLTVAAPGALSNDTDPDRGTVLAIDQVDGSGARVGVAYRTARGATVRVNANGSLSYDPTGQFDALRPGQEVRETITYRATDGAANDTATITVTVRGVNDAPTGVADSYDGVGNTTLVVSDPQPAGEAAKQLTGSVSANDTDPDHTPAELSVRAERVSSALGGSATIDADGTFTYVPPTGTTGTDDSFEYSITDGDRTARGRVTIRLSGRVWYVDNSEAAGGTGRSSDSFDTLAEATGASTAGDTIFVRTGDGTTRGMAAGATLDTNERLLGEATDLVVGGDQLYDGAAARRPSISNAAGVGVALATGSHVEGLAVSAAGGAAISGRAGVAGSTLRDLTIAGSGGGISLTGTSGTFTVADTTISTTGGTGLAASSAGTLALTSAGTISVRSTGGQAVAISGTALSGAIDAITAGGSAGGVSLQTTSGSIALGDVAIDVTGGSGFVADGVAGLSVPAAGAVTVRNTGGTAVAVRNSVAPNTTFDTVTGTGAGATGIDVSGNSGGGTTTFGSPVTVSSTTATGVRLASNGGHTIAFGGGSLGVTTTSGDGFAATGGGTVTVAGTGNVVRSTTGTPLRITGTTIGAADATFQSISANGAANGIVLDQTGSTGNLAVTGTGAADSGGTIQNVRGADGSNAGVGVYLNQTSDVALTALRLTNSDGHAIRGTSVNGFTLDRSTIDGVHGTNDAVNEGGLLLRDLTGTSRITNSSVSGGFEDNAVISSSRGTLGLTLDNDTFGANSTALGGNSVLLTAEGTSDVTTSVTRTAFTSSREDLFQHNVTDTAQSDFTFDGNTLSNNHPAPLGGSGLLVATSGNGGGADLDYRITGNRLTDMSGGGIFVVKGTGIAAASGTISGNTIGTAGDVGSGAPIGSGITAESRGQGSHVLRIANNTIRQYTQNGIRTVHGEPSVADNGVVNVALTVTGNTVTEPSGTLATAVGFRNEAAHPDAVVDQCLDFRGNNMVGSAGASGQEVRVRHIFTQNTVRLPGYAGGPEDTTAVTNYFAANNTLTAGRTGVISPGGGAGYVNGGAGCAQP